LDDFVFDIVFLFLVFVLTGSWILGEGLSGVRCFTFVLPKLASFRFGEETLWFLSNEHAVRIVSEMIVCFFFNGMDGLICSWAWSKTSFFLIFAVWNAALENFVLSGRVELLLAHLIEIIHSRSWILCPTFVVMSVISLFKQLSVDF